MKDVIGGHLKDPFFDSYHEEALTSYDILELCNESADNFVRLCIDKEFLRRLVRSHLLKIKDIEKILNAD